MRIFITQIRNLVFYLLLILSESLFCQSSGWFFINPQPTNMGLSAVKVFNQNNAIAIGNYGTVMRTTDGGLNWSNPLSTTAITGLENLHYLDLNFFDENTGFIIGDNAGGTAKLFKTINKGNTWSFISQLALYSPTIHFINQNTGWVGGSTQILKTTNGGFNWQNSSTSFPSQITDVLFLNTLTGFAAVSSSKLYITTDGGLNWDVNNTSAPSYARLFFINNQTGFACGGGSVIQKTTNSGLTWITKFSNNQTDILSSICFIDGLTGFSVGGGFGNPPACIYRSTDAGETWNQIAINTINYHLNSIGFSGNLGLIVGYGGKVLRSTNQGSNWTVSPSFHQPGLSFCSLSFIDANTGWIAIGGYTGGVPIYKSLNGGLNWEIIYTAQPAPELLKFLNANTGYYKVGNTLYKSTNSGYNWTQLPPLNINVRDINFADANTVWASGYTTPPMTPRFIKTTDGGSTWNTIPVTLDYSSVEAFNFINSNTGWICKAYAVYPMGTNCKIFRTINGGQNWDDLRYDSGFAYRKISFINNLTGWASCNYKFIRTTNGGNNWTILQDSVAGNNFQFIDANTGWIPSIFGPFYKTTNGGINWYSQVDIGFAGLSAFQFINGQTGWAVGFEGMILKTTNGGEIVSIPNLSKKSDVTQNYFLSQNYPNPFNPSTTIEFDIPKSGHVALSLYDITGRLVEVLANELVSPGRYRVSWDGKNYSSGVYFYTLKTNSFIQTKRMVLIK